MQKSAVAAQASAFDHPGAAQVYSKPESLLCSLRRHSPQRGRRVQQQMENTMLRGVEVFRGILHLVFPITSSSAMMILELLRTSTLPHTHSVLKPRQLSNILLLCFSCPFCGTIPEGYERCSPCETTKGTKLAPFPFRNLPPRSSLHEGAKLDQESA